MPSLTVFAPDLLATAAVEPAGQPLSHLVARARQTALLPEDPLVRQRRLLDPAATISATPAALMREGDGIDATAGCWLRADPVTLKPDRATLRLFDAHSFALDLAEADALIAALNAELGDAGWRLHRGPSPRRWYLGLETALAANAPPPWQVALGDYDRCLPVGPDAVRLRRWLNDAQMVLHASPVNAARERRGDPPINSVWFWGNTPVETSPPVAQAKTPAQFIFADDPLSRALARRLDLPCLPLPDATRLRQELATRRGQSAALILVPDSALEPAPAAYLASLATELRALLRRGLCRRIVIDTGRELWTLGRFDALCFWRRARPVTAHG